MLYQRMVGSQQVCFLTLDHFGLRFRAVTNNQPYAEGRSVAAILAEGSIVLHSYPYKGLITIDYIDDKDKSSFKREDFFRTIQGLFRPKYIRYVITDRISFEVIDAGKWEDT